MTRLDAPQIDVADALGVTPRPVHNIAGRAAGFAIAVVCALPILRYLWVAVHRIGYPFELEWMEGGAVEVVDRVLHGQGIYGPPTLHFVPWTYTPLYFWVSAAVAEVTGIGFTPLRLVSFAASLAVLWILYRMVKQVTGDRVAGLAAAGLYAATFQLAGSWADIGRVDSLFLAFLLAALASARTARSPRAGVVVGLLFFLSFFTKQDALIVAVPVVAWMALARRRAGLAAAATLIGLVVGSTVVMDVFTHGWYRYYVFEELLHQGIVPENWVDFWRFDIFHPLALSIASAALGMAVLAVWYRPAALLRLREPGFWVVASGGLLAAAWVGRLHNGGYNDVLMPAYAAVALGVGVVVGLVRRHPRSAVRLSASVVVALVLWGQFHRIGYSTSAEIPSATDLQAGRAFIRLVENLPGQVLVFDHPYYGVMAGKGTVADEEAVGEIERAGPSYARRLLLANLRTALLHPGIGAVIFDDPGDEAHLQGELAAQYHLLPPLVYAGHAFFPVTDLPLRPTLVYVRDARYLEESRHGG